MKNSKTKKDKEKEKDAETIKNITSFFKPKTTTGDLNQVNEKNIANKQGMSISIINKQEHSNKDKDNSKAQEIKKS